MTTSSPAAPRPKITAATPDALHSNNGSMVVNDPSGLCLVNKGSITDNTGALTNLTRLAQQLQSNENTSNPLIALEYASTSILLKDYDGHAVAVQVDKKTPNEQEGDGGGSAATETGK